MFDDLRKLRKLGSVREGGGRSEAEGFFTDVHPRRPAPCLGWPKRGDPSHRAPMNPIEINMAVASAVRTNVVDIVFIVFSCAETRIH